jgi:predicted nucleotidyltransferase
MADPVDPTPYTDLNAVLQELVGAVRGVFAEELVGVYLQGSFAVGDFDRDSDADFIVVLEDESADADVSNLRAAYGGVFDLPNPWAKHLEGSFLPQGLLRDGRRAGEPVWYFDHGRREIERSAHCNTLVVRSTLRQHGICLVGPSPASLIDPVPVAALRAEMRETAICWGREILAAPDRWANRFYQGFIVLNYSRILRDLHAGEVGSKRIGATWMKRRDPRFAGLIDRAWAPRFNPVKSVGEPADTDEYQRTLEFLRYVMSECERFDAARHQVPRDGP